jgi:hypothetical protein
MIRLAWRQLRLPALTVAALTVGFAVVLLVTHRQMTEYADHSGLTSCLQAESDCSIGMSNFEQRYGRWLTMLVSLAFLPMATGMFLGAPLMSRELEHGTHRLVWTQSISRGRWLATKLTIVVAGLLVVGATASLAFGIWARTWSTVDQAGYSRIQPAMFALQGTVLTASMLAAFAIGLAASAVIRRTIVAMAIALASYAIITLGLQLTAPHLVPATTVTFPFGAHSPRHGLGDWLLSEDVIDPAGRRIDQATLQTTCPAPNPAGGLRGIDTTCAVAHGYQFHDAYEPLSAFWRLQMVDSAILVALAAILTALAAWKIIRHTS